MFCGQCGKRVLETMLFCPFCGSPIVIPDQDGEAADIVMPAGPAEQQIAEAAQDPFEVPEESEVREEPEPEETEVREAPEPEEPEPEASAPEEVLQPEPDEAFEPLWFDEPEDEIEPEPEVPSIEAEADRPLSLFDDFPEEEIFASLEADAPEPDDSEDFVPPRPQAPARRRPEGAARRSNQTFIPVRDVDPDDMFMDSSHPDPDDDYDPYDDDIEEGVRRDFDFEEPERGGFLQRHIRGMVGLALLVVLLVIFLFWAIMPSGQRVLAGANLAWRAEAYGELGYAAFSDGQYHQAAVCFERALARESDDYEYAHSAMVAYYEANETDSALAMLKKCIEMNPDSSEPYCELLLIYPDADARPWEVRELLRLGYERTGDEALNVGTSGE